MNDEIDIFDEPIFSPIKDSVATRSINTKSRQAFLVEVAHGARHIRCESWTEYMALLAIKALCPGLRDIVEQPAPITYVDESGKTARHFLDFLVTLANGERVGVAVKPEASTRKTNFRAKLRLIAAAMPASFASRIVLITDLSLPRALRRWASAVRSCMADREHCPTQAQRDDECAADLIGRLRGSVTIGTLTERLDLPDGRGWRAVMRAIADGLLSLPAIYSFERDAFVRAMARS